MLLSTKNLSVPLDFVKKFAPKLIGPFTITDVYADGNAYKLDLPVQYRKLHRVFHVSLLKPYHFLPTPSQGDTFQFETSQQDQIERILSHRISNGVLEILVHFKNSDSINDSWISAETLSNASGLFSEYQERLHSSV